MLQLHEVEIKTKKTLITESKLINVHYHSLWILKSQDALKKWRYSKIYQHIHTK